MPSQYDKRYLGLRPSSCYLKCGHILKVCALVLYQGLSVNNNLSIHRSREIPDNSPSSSSEIGKGALAESYRTKEDLEGEGCVIRGRKTRVAWRDGPCWAQSPTTSTWSNGYRVGWTRRALPALRSCSTFKHHWGGEEATIHS